MYFSDERAVPCLDFDVEPSRPKTFDLDRGEYEIRWYSQAHRVRTHQRIVVQQPGRLTVSLDHHRLVEVVQL